MHWSDTELHEGSGEFFGLTVDVEEGDVPRRTPFAIEVARPWHVRVVCSEPKASQGIADIHDSGSEIIAKSLGVLSILVDIPLSAEVSAEADKRFPTCRRLCETFAKEWSFPRVAAAV